MLADLAWIPRGVAKTKLPEDVDGNEDMDVSGNSDQEDDNDMLADTNRDEDESEAVDVSEVLANDLDNLSFYKKGERDPHLSSGPKANKIFDEEELEDLTIQSTDAVVISVHSGEDVSLLMTHVFDDNPDESDDESNSYVPHTYIHHDIVLPTLPLCAAHTSLQVNDDVVNLVAVGMFTPGIEVWDIDQVNNLEPVASLGGYGASSVVKDALAAANKVRAGGSRKRKKKPQLKLRDGSHTDAVMSLSWNSTQREYLASGSADHTVKVWDIESAHCASTFSHHDGKVQAVAFHPSEAELLLTGSFDKTVQVLDVRDPGKKGKWSVNADVETCAWGHGQLSNVVITTTEDGYVSVFDSRMAGKDASPLSRWQAHKGAVSSCAVSRDIPGLMVTGSVDKQIKVWDISRVGSEEVESIYQRPSKAGAVFALSLCPLPDSETNASPFVIAYGGSKGSLGVIDLAVESEAVRERFMYHCGAAAAKVIKKRSERRAFVTDRAQSKRSKQIRNGGQKDPDSEPENSSDNSRTDDD
ncbi:Periodic tryptophan protein 1-like [Gracilariopsis chorda]|uniref:Periodic tryptophan protein 1-like n=1 Tax=Gracilariopsis chorda TaxID=448386 RepID=A0A2V3J302_9FLOR|nr:Periodic tryptophan protein 1-like [Gracilariopsis chorda]|eukprot:PXF47770.1 Periodic tryptophan protein 1-like [Gracilariopsis chorda]